MRFESTVGGIWGLFGFGHHPNPPYVPQGAPVQGKYPAVASRYDPTVAMRRPDAPSVYVAGTSFFDPHNSQYFGLDKDGEASEWHPDVTGVPQCIDSIYRGFAEMYGSKGGPIAELFGGPVAAKIFEKYGYADSSQAVMSEYTEQGAFRMYTRADGKRGYFDIDRQWWAADTGPFHAMSNFDGGWNGKLVRLKDGDESTVETYQLVYSHAPGPITHPAPAGEPPPGYPGGPAQCWLDTGFSTTPAQDAYLEAVALSNGHTLADWQATIAAQNAKSLAWARKWGEFKGDDAHPYPYKRQADLIHARLGP